MKLWKIEYSQEPSNYEASVILAETKEDVLKIAEEMVKKKEGDWQDLDLGSEYSKEKTKIVDAHIYLQEVPLLEPLGEPVESYVEIKGGCVRLKTTKIHLTEVPMDKPMEIYTGFYCC